MSYPTIFHRNIKFRRRMAAWVVAFMAFVAWSEVPGFAGLISFADSVRPAELAATFDNRGMSLDQLVGRVLKDRGAATANSCRSLSSCPALAAAPVELPPSEPMPFGSAPSEPTFLGLAIPGPSSGTGTGSESSSGSGSSLAMAFFISVSELSRPTLLGRHYAVEVLHISRDCYFELLRPPQVFMSLS